MKTKEFYARALLAALPVIIEKYDTKEAKPKIIEIAAGYAELLTEKFKEKGAGETFDPPVATDETFDPPA